MLLGVNDTTRVLGHAAIFTSYPPREDARLTLGPAVYRGGAVVGSETELRSGRNLAQLTPVEGSIVDSVTDLRSGG